MKVFTGSVLGVTLTNLHKSFLLATALACFAESAAASSVGLLEVSFDGTEMEDIYYVPGDGTYYPSGSLFLTYDPDAPELPSGAHFYFGLANGANGGNPIAVSGFQGDYAGSYEGRIAYGSSSGVFLTDTTGVPFPELELQIFFNGPAIEEIFAASLGDVLIISDIDIFEYGYDFDYDTWMIDYDSIAYFNENSNGVTVTILEKAVSDTVSPVPLPESLPMLAIALGGLAAMTRRRSARG